MLSHPALTVTERNFFTKCFVKILTGLWDVLGFEASHEERFSTICNTPMSARSLGKRLWQGWGRLKKGLSHPRRGTWCRVYLSRHVLPHSSCWMWISKADLSNSGFSICLMNLIIQEALHSSGRLMLYLVDIHCVILKLHPDCELSRSVPRYSKVNRNDKIERCEMWRDVKGWRHTDRLDQRSSTSL